MTQITIEASREDVEFLRRELDNVDGGSEFDTPEWAAHLRDLASRIEAALENPGPRTPEEG